MKRSIGALALAASLALAAGCAPAGLADAVIHAAAGAALRFAASHAAADVSLAERPGPLAVSDAVTVSATAPEKVARQDAAPRPVAIARVPISRDLSSIRPPCRTASWAVVREVRRVPSA